MTKKKTTLLPAVPSPGLPQHIKAGKRNLSIDVRFMIDFLVRLLNTPNPTGYTTQAQALVRETLADLKLDTRFNAKGGLIATWHGKSSTHPRALTAHVDTLGAMVKEIDVHTGRLRLSRLGVVTWNSVRGRFAGCKIHRVNSVSLHVPRLQGQLLYVEFVRVIVRTDRQKFLGENGYGSWANPIGLQAPELSNTEALRGDNIAALLHHLGVLQPGQSKRFITQLGQVDHIESALASIAKYRQAKEVDRALVEIKAFWEAYLSKLQCQTPDADFNRMINVHNARQ